MISVIIPVYNGEKYIQSLVKCFEKQKERNFELIFINDGSKDNSMYQLNSVKDISRLKITIVDQQNAGVSAARNVGIKIAKGKLVCFCDVDDEVMDGYLSEMRSAMEKTDAELVICKSKLIQMDGTEVIKIPAETGEISTKDTITCLRDFLYGRMVSGVWTIMVRKELLVNNQLWFAEGYKYSEDLHMVWRLIACSTKITYLDKQLYIYMLQENSATSKFNSDRLHGYDLMKGLESYFKNKSPQFAEEYKKYGAARLLWSITWQASTKYDLKDFKKFIRSYNVKKEMLKLRTFNSRKVSFSASLLLIAPSLFRYLAIRHGKKYTH